MAEGNASGGRVVAAVDGAETEMMKSWRNFAKDLTKLERKISMYHRNPDSNTTYTNQKIQSSHLQVAKAISSKFNRLSKASKCNNYGALTASRHAVWVVVSITGEVERITFQICKHGSRWLRQITTAKTKRQQQQ